MKVSDDTLLARLDRMATEAEEQARKLREAAQLAAGRKRKVKRNGERVWVELER